MAFRLDSSDRVLIFDGKIDQDVLEGLVSEAWNFQDVYAESKIVFKRKYNFDGKFREEESSTTYKELWDCYSNLSGMEDFDPSYKDIPLSLKRDFLVESFRTNLSDPIIGDFYNL